ncbi:hypothetical protein M406DRAFT_358150 [Cryphonectria parasitica EP155]|uniref:Late endosomal/lysosomal adaptor and MAPK and MTOR activator-domain-containing protein n=1 Tax=Cryphonectria parasitica (strain ATCC 38755 / EP155) TaxID=660469 RepID=A0A9P4XVA3_CRYP1|nr:uncharacterized protein M406DRAFT_358150 [Cryphonectria parasitica EP155]KAF3761934.1 hypothetical protein M406DRAFT_358150 [Cryphonectria parasitica EP155]
MGACSSCLGGRRRDSVQEDEESRLLFDDPNVMQYGSFGEQQMTGQHDPLEAQREIEALQRVVAQTSDNMVDIFEIAPTKDAQRSAPTTPYALVGQEARHMRYRSLLSKLSAEDVSAAGARVDWLADDDEEALDQHNIIPHVKTESSDALVGNFSEAASAMA